MLRVRVLSLRPIEKPLENLPEAFFILRRIIIDMERLLWYNICLDFRKGGEKLADNIARRDNTAYTVLCLLFVLPDGLYRG